MDESKRIPPTFGSFGPPKRIRLRPISGLSFQDSLDAYKFDRFVEEKISSNVGSYLQSLPGTAAVTLDVLMSFKSAGLQVVFTPETIKAIQQGTVELVKSGDKFLPLARDSTSKNFTEMARIVSGSATVASTSVAAALVVVQLAHIISSADISKRLRELDSKIDMILERNEIDKRVVLESLFYDVQTLTSDRSPSPESHEYKNKAKEIHSELIQLRAAWREQIVADFQNLKSPNKRGWLDRLTTWPGTIAERNRSVFRSIANRLHLIQYTLRLDRILLADIGDWQVAHGSLPFEVRELKHVVRKLSDAGKYMDNEAEVLQWKKFAELVLEEFSGFDPSAISETVDSSIAGLEFGGNDRLDFERPEADMTGTERQITNIQE